MHKPGQRRGRATRGEDQLRRLPVDEYLVLHITAAADQLLEHLAAIEGTALPDQGIIAVLARAGAQQLVSGIELDGSAAAAAASSLPAWTSPVSTGHGLADAAVA